MTEHVDKCDKCGLELTDIDMGFCVSLQGMGHQDCGGTFVKVEMAQ